MQLKRNRMPNTVTTAETVTPSMKQMRIRKNNEYELVKTGGPGTSLYRIKALREIPLCGISVGDLGGFVSGEHNLSQYGDCWIFGEAIVSERAVVSEMARVSGKAVVAGGARIFGYAQVFGEARIFGEAMYLEKLRYLMML